MCSDICLDCENTFICTYCSHREHKQHYFDSIKNQAETCRNILSVEFNKLKQDVPPINISYETEIQKFNDEREKLKVELEERSIHKLREFIAMLSKEKERILKAFDDNVAHYISYLNKLQLLTTKNNHEAFDKYVTSVKEKKDLVILNEMKEMIENCKSYLSLQCFDGNLTNIDEQNILGDLEIKFDGNEYKEDVDVVSMLFNEKYFDDAVRKADDYANIDQYVQGN